MHRLSVKRIIPSLLLVCLLPISASAANQQSTAQNSHEADHATHQALAPATQDFIIAMNKMHKPMMDGIMAEDADVAFVQGMIPHHQGAIDMAEIVLKYGKDSKIRELAENIIKAQQQEIAMMQAWLANHNNQ